MYPPERRLGRWIFHNVVWTARGITAQYNALIDYVESDSVEFLKNYMNSIDLLYLDSMDVPLHEGADRTPCQEHNLKEFQAAEPKLHRKSIVLLDDYFGGNGKPRLCEPYMMSRGWRRILGYQQLLFVK